MARRVEPKGARLLPVAPRGRCGSIRTLTRLRQSPRLGLQLPHLGPTWQKLGNGTFPVPAPWDLHIVSQLWSPDLSVTELQPPQSVFPVTLAISCPGPGRNPWTLHLKQTITGSEKPLGLSHRLTVLPPLPGGTASLGLAGPGGSSYRGTSAPSSGQSWEKALPPPHWATQVWTMHAFVNDS